MSEQSPQERPAQKGNFRSGLATVTVTHDQRFFDSAPCDPRHHCHVAVLKPTHPKAPDNYSLCLQPSLLPSADLVPPIPVSLMPIRQPCPAVGVLARRATRRLASLHRSRRRLSRKLYFLPPVSWWQTCFGDKGEQGSQRCGQCREGRCGRPPPLPLPEGHGCLRLVYCNRAFLCGWLAATCRRQPQP